MTSTSELIIKHSSKCFCNSIQRCISLAQGEYVCVSQLEVTYTASSQAIRQMFIYGKSLRDYLLAVIVPTEGARTNTIFKDMVFRKKRPDSAMELMCSADKDSWKSSPGYFLSCLFSFSKGGAFSSTHAPAVVCLNAR